MFQSDLIHIAAEHLDRKHVRLIAPDPTKPPSPADKEVLDSYKSQCTHGEHSVRIIGSLIRQAIPINIQPVADYIFQGTEQEDWYLETDFPNLAPPWETAWFHWNPPTWVRSEGDIIQSPMMKDYEYGCLNMGLPSEQFRPPNDDKNLVPPPEAKWLQCFYLFSRMKSTGVISWYSFKFFVDGQGNGLFKTGGLHVSEPHDWPTGEERMFKHGSGPFSPHSKFKFMNETEEITINSLDRVNHAIRALDKLKGEHPELIEQHLTGGVKVDPWGIARSGKYTEPEHPPIENDVIATLFPVFLATSFCHCKNVAVTEIPIPDKVLKKRSAKGIWTPKVRREIHIEPMKKILRHTPGTKQDDLKRQLVIRRGHFKDFKEGRGLFGKHHGLYWWESFVRDTTNVRYQVEGKS